MLGNTTVQVAELVRALAVAWKNLTAYPPGHPALVASIESAHRRLLDMRGPAGEVVFGVSSDGLIYGSEKIESSHVQKFAQALFTRRIAILSFAAETTASDVETLLRLLGSGGPGDDKRPPLWEQLTGAGVLNINLQPVDYSAVQITSDLTEKKKSESLWDDILRALIAGREMTPAAIRLQAQNPRSVEEVTALIVKYIEDSGAEMPAFDADATFGIRRVASDPDPPEMIRARVAQAIALHVGGSSGLKKQFAVQQVRQLLRTFPEPLRATVMRSVMRELATEEKTGSLLREFTSELPPDEVLDALRYVASMGKLSIHAVRLLESLAALTDTRKLPEAAPAELLTELVSLFGEDDIDRFNPEEHRALLDEVSIEVPVFTTAPQPAAVLGDRVDTIAPEILHRDFGLSLVELIPRAAAKSRAPLLARVEAVFRSLLVNGGFVDAQVLVDHLQELAHMPEVAGTLSNLATVESMRILVDRALAGKPEEVVPIQRLLQALGAAAMRNLLSALAEEDNRSRRRRLFDLVASLGPSIVKEAIPFLSDPRWYVVRNIVVLLRTVNDRSSLPAIRRIADHPDLRVRLEAIKTLVAFDSMVPTALLEKAIGDPDPKLAETAIKLVGSYGIKEAVDPLLKITAGNDIFRSRTALRVHALRALGELGEPRALAQLTRFFRDSFLPWPSRPERLAAFQSLGGYAPDARAPFVENGLKSRDAEVRDVCHHLWSAEWKS
ncbi:MAG TPA: HEAT repeat domain-containing protein [Thermoanaerobaculia bacterium]|nr:HEAT repeat domain-containing protein [Thermoanaerobaculia bacterium]